MANRLEKNPLHFIDKNNFVITQEQDISSRAGNSAQHTMMWIIGMYSLSQNKVEAFIQAKKRVFMCWLLVNKQLEPTLHWDNRYWPGQIGHMSRDNLQGFICAMKLFDLKKGLRLLMLRILLRFGFLWNTKHIGQTEDKKKIPDFCGPLMWLLYTRFKFNPLNLVSDIYLALAIKIASYRVSLSDKHCGEHLNLIMIAETCRLISSNFILSRVLKNYKLSGIPQRSLKVYFAPEYAAPLDSLWIKIIQRW